MKKRLDVNPIQNELRGGSAFFPGYKGSGSPADSADRPGMAAELDGLRATEPLGKPPEPSQVVPERVNAPTPVRPNGKRIITRNSFEIYEDQMGSLRRLSYVEKMDGKLGSMSGMVREALDEYLQKRASGR